MNNEYKRRLEYSFKIDFASNTDRYITLSYFTSKKNSVEDINRINMERESY